jgi:hypothetical protein
VEAAAFKEAHRVSDAQSARYAQLHFDDPPRHSFADALRRALRRIRLGAGRRS